MTGKVPHAKYECVKYNWQSTGGQKTLRSKNQLAKTNLVKYDRQMDARQSTSWAIQLAGKLRSTLKRSKLALSSILTSFLKKQIKMDCKQSREILDFPQAPDGIEMCEKNS